MKKRLSMYFAFILSIVLSVSTIVSPVSQGNIVKAAEVRMDGEENVSALEETGEKDETGQGDIEEKTDSEDAEIIADTIEEQTSKTTKMGEETKIDETADTAEEIQMAEFTDKTEELDVSESMDAMGETQADVETEQENGSEVDSTDEIQEATQIVEAGTEESKTVREGERLDLICSQTDSIAPDYDIWLSDTIRTGLKVDGTIYGNSIYEMFLNMQEPIYAELGGLLSKDVPLMSISSVWHDVVKHEFYENQKLIYETLIIDYMKYKNSESSSKFDTSQIDRANSYLIDIFGELSDQYLDEGIYNWKPEDFLNLSVEDAAKSLKKVENMKKIVDRAEKFASNTKEFLIIITNIKALEDAKEEKVQILKYARNACAAMPSPNSDFIKACDEIIAELDSTVITADYVMNAFASAGMKKVMDKVWDKLADSNPILKAIDLNSGAMDILFSTSDNASNNLKLLLLYTMDCYFKMGLSNVSSAYQLNPTSENAMAFNGCFEGYLDFQMYGNTVAKSWISEVTDGGALNHAYTYIFHRENLKAASELKDLCDSQNAMRQNIINLISEYQDMYNGLYVEETYKEVLDYEPTTSVEENIDDVLKISDGIESSLASRKKLTDSGKCGDNVYWKLYEDTLIIYGSGDMANYDALGSPEWYGYHLDIKSIIISSGVTSIGDYAFSHCSSLSGINIPDKVISIGKSAFSGCSSLSEISIPEGVTSIESYTFFYCSSLSKISIPKGVTGIGYCTFCGCSSLREINIPEGVTSIEHEAFCGCSSLREINIPKGVTSIEWSAFNSCSSLREINIPEGVTSIGNSAFSSCSSLRKINIPERVTSIGEYAFYNCNSLNEISIPERVTSIQSNTFVGCNSLSKISIPKGVTSIGTGAFSNCSSLKEINIPEGITSINRSTFSGCSSLREISIPEGVMSIEYDAFSDCSSLTEIKIPKGVTSIGQTAFFRCGSLREINIPEGVKSIGYFAFGNCSSLREINIPKGVTSIGDGAFNNCSSLREINIPKGVTSIRDSVFYGCSSLSEIRIPEGIMSIGCQAFYRCENLNKINILDKNCEIYDSQYTISDTATVYGYANSTAEAYAKKYNRKFQALDVQSSNTYTITYNANGGKNAPSAQTKKENENLTLSEKKPTRTGYTFLGWSTSKSSTKATYTAGASFKENKNTTLYAVWKANTYKIAFNKNGGTGSMTTISCTYSKNYTLPANAFKRKGYTFKGWNTKADGTGSYSYGDKATVKNVSSVNGKTMKFYAQWTANKYKIAFDKNGGIGSMATISCTYGKNYTLPANTFKRTGYTFKGWNTKADGTGSYSYANKATVKNVSSVNGKTMKLYAQWTAKKYSITYQLNGGTNNKSNPTSYKITTATITLKNPTRKGYTFGGWYTSSSYKTKVTKIVKESTGNKTLYAKWKKSSKA